MVFEDVESVGGDAGQPAPSIDPDGPFEDVADLLGERTEPAVPNSFDDAVRRQVRVLDEDTELAKKHKPYVECGCGDCPSVADPLHDIGSESFDDVRAPDNYALYECPTPRPMTIERAATAYYVYEKSLHDSDDKTSACERVRYKQHPAVMADERELLGRWANDELSICLQTFRLPPVTRLYSETRAEQVMESAGGGDGGGAYYGVEFGQDLPPGENATARVWRPPQLVVEDLVRGCKAALDKQRTKFRYSDFEGWEYVRVFGATDSAATPHAHLVHYVRDSQDELDCGFFEDAVDAFVAEVDTARPEDHTVVPGESDAAVVDTDPTLVDLSDEQARNIFDERDGESYRPNTAALAYLHHQRPHWVMKRLLEDGADREDERTALEGAAIARMTTKDWVSSSAAFSFTLAE